MIDLETRDALGYYPRKYKKGNRFFENLLPFFGLYGWTVAV